MIVILLFAVSGVLAQSGGGFDIPWFTIDNGGGQSSGGGFSVSGTAGQPDAGQMSGGGFSVSGGFWNAVPVSPAKSYLPLVMRNFPPCSVWVSTDVPKAIPDNNVNGVESVVVLTTSIPPAGITVQIDQLLHGYTGDLMISLIGPNGLTVVLVNRRGGDGANFIGTRLSDSYTTPIASGTPPFTGNFRPDNSLLPFVGQNPSGTWRLKVADLATDDVGLLNAWRLELCT